MLTRLATALLLALPTPVADCGCWRYVRVGGESRGTDESLEAVTAPASDAVWAIGSRGGGSLLVRWTGSRWRAERPALPAGTLLTGISADTPGDAWTVGYTLKGVPQAAHGRGWAPSAMPGQGFPRAVWARAADDVWAVGSGGPGTVRATSWHWDGRSWRQLRIADPTDVGSDLVAVSGRAATDVWAVGGRGAYPPHLLVLHNDGRGWSPSPTPALTGEPAPAAIAALGANDVWLVGALQGRPLAMHWDGRQWSTVPVPGADGRFAAVAGDGEGGVWAAGTRAGGSPFFAHWTAGQGWDLTAAPIPAPAVPTGVQGLARVPGSTSLWAVGTQQTGTALTWTNVPRPR